LWSVSATNAGKVEAIKLQVLEKDPYIILEEGTITVEQRAFLDPLKRWFECIKTAPKEAEELAKQVEEVAKKAEELVTKGPEEVKALNDTIAEAMAIKDLASNAAKLGKQVPKVKELPKVCKEVAEAI